jgi:hypothetical protein
MSLQVQHFFETLYPGVHEGYLVLSHPSPSRQHKDGSQALDSSWHNLATTTLARIAERAEALSAAHSVYFGVAIQHPSRQPNPFQRSQNASAYIMPGLYFDLDIASGAHAASALPATAEEALAFLHALPAPPSLVVHTGGGLHAYWLFDTPVWLHTEGDRATMQHLMRQCTHTLCQRGAALGWTLDALRDLARVLRPAGTVNHKYGTPVTILEEHTHRYTTADFGWLTPLPAPSVHHGNGHTVGAQPDLVAVVEAYGGTLTQKSEHELHGAHPQHGSSTGTNLDINSSEGLFHCWRHGTGGDAFSLIAVCAGLVACADLQPGALSGAIFPKVLDIAHDQFGWTPPATATPPDPTDDPAELADLLRRAQADAAQRGNGHQPGPEPTDPFACPELPASAKVDDERAKEASIFLDDYIAFSQHWAPRAYEGFHEATGLFTLSTTGAHRVKIELGPHGVYTSLYLALAARTSLYTKTTAVDLALALLRRAGLQPLLADDDATPQAFLRSLTLYIPPDYGDLPAEAQEAIRDRLAFAGQKGWFYEEWGQHLHAMMQKEGPMAAFRSILRRLDDHKDEYVYASISRGRDILIKPYVALLANVTPADLKPFLRAQSPLWRDGYIARFAFIAPGECPASTAPFPEGAMKIPDPLITTLASWHKRLGIPRVVLSPVTDAKGKATGRYQPTFTQPHRETTYALSPEVRTAFYAYDAALHTLMAQSTNEDLDGSYARLPMKALRIAGLLASLHDDSSSYTIWPRHWYRGQQITERWRRDLHRLIKQVGEAESVSRESKTEQRLLTVLRHNAALSLRDIHLKTKLAYSNIEHTLRPLVSVGVVREKTTTRTKKYAYVFEDGDEPYIGQADL